MKKAPDKLYILKRMSDAEVYDDKTNETLEKNSKDKLLSPNWASAMLCGEMIGAGSLSLSVAVQRIGFYTAFVLYLFLTCLSAYFAYLIGKTYSTCRVRIKEIINNGHLRDPYPQLARFTIGNKAMYLVIVSIITSDFLATAGLLLLPADTLVNSFECYISNSLSSTANVRLWVVIFSLILIPFTWNDRPKDNKAVAFITLFTAVLGNILILVLYYISAEEKVVHAEAPDNRPIGAVHKYIMAIGILLTTTDGFDILPTIQEDMKDVTDYPKVILRSYLAFTCITIPVMIGGYWLFHRDYHMSDNILIELSMAGNQLPPGTTVHLTFKILSYITVALFITHILLSAVLQLNPSFQYIESKFTCKEGFCWKRCVLRGTMVISIMLFVLVAPSLLTILSFNGSILFIVLGIAIPGLMYLKTFVSSMWLTAFILTVIIVSLFYLAVNSYYSILTLILVAENT